MQAPGVAAGERTAQETVEVGHGFGNNNVALGAGLHIVRQVHGEFRIHAAEQATDRELRVGVVVIAKRDRENATECRVLRILVAASRHVVIGVGTETTDQVVGVKVCISRVVKDAHVIHDVGRVLAHGFHTSKSRECGTNAQDTESGTECSCSS